MVVVETDEGAGEFTPSLLILSPAPAMVLDASTLLSLLPLAGDLDERDDGVLPGPMCKDSGVS